MESEFALDFLLGPDINNEKISVGMIAFGLILIGWGTENQMSKQTEFLKKEKFFIWQLLMRRIRHILFLFGTCIVQKNLYWNKYKTQKAKNIKKHRKVSFV